MKPTAQVEKIRRAPSFYLKSLERGGTIVGMSFIEVFALSHGMPHEKQSQVSALSPGPLVNTAAVPVPGVRPVFFFAASSCFSASMLFT